MLFVDKAILDESDKMSLTIKIKEEHNLKLLSYFNFVGMHSTAWSI